MEKLYGVEIQKSIKLSTDELEKIISNFLLEKHGVEVSIRVRIASGDYYAMVQDVPLVTITNFEELNEEAQIELSDNYGYEPNDIYFGFNVIGEIINYKNIKKVNPNELILEGI